MLLQLIASYGHLHPQDYNILLAGHSAPALAAPHGSSHGPADGLAADIDCPICASMQLLGSGALPDGVPLLALSSHHAKLAAGAEAFHLTPPPHLLFTTRAPPLV